MVLSPAPAHSGDSAKSIAPASTTLGTSRADHARAGPALARRLKGQVERYARTWLWVARDGMRRFRLRVAVIVALNVLGLAAALAAVWGVMTYARHAQQDQPLRLPGLTITLADGLGPLIQFGAVIATLGLISATCTYFTDRMVLAIARQYQGLCAERVLTIAADPLCRGWQVAEDEPPRTIVLRLIGASSRAMGLTLRDMLRLILPALTFIAAVAVLCVVNSWLTLWLVPIAAIYLLPLYLINRRVTHMQRRYRELAPIARSELSRCLRGSLASGTLAAEVAKVQREAINGDASQGASTALYGRMLADRRVHLLNAAFFIACLVVLLVVFGSQSDEGHAARRWADLIIYLLALRFAITSLRQTTAFLAKFSRFFGETHRYERFVRLGERCQARHVAMGVQSWPLPPTLTLRLERGPRWDSPRTMSIPTRGILWILTPLRAGHDDLEAIAVRMEQRLREQGVDLAARAGFAARPERLSVTGADVVFITHAVAEFAMTQSTAAAIVERGLLIIVGNDPEAMLRSADLRPIGRIVVMDGVRFIGGGDNAWLRDHAREIAAFLVSHRPELRSGAATNASLDADDEDDE